MKNKLVINKNLTFEEAIKLLDENGTGFLAVVDENRKLLGIITDGDVRRAILNKKADLKDIINHNPTTLNVRVPKKQAIQYLKSIHRRHLPLVDDNNCLVDVIVLDDLEFNAKPNSIVIMAGGYGKRLGDLTKDTPKPMLTVGNKPLLEHILSYCYGYGFENVYISVNYKSEVIKNYFKNGADFGVKIKYVEEKQKLGTAGSLSLIKEIFKEPFVVINGDVLTAIDFDDLLNYHVSKKAMATVCVREIQYQIPYGVVKIDRNNSNISSIIEKPTQKIFINAGIYILNPELKDYVPSNQYFDMTSLLQVFLQKKMLVNSYVVNDYWVDIGEKNSYEAAQKDLET